MLEIELNINASQKYFHPILSTLYTLQYHKYSCSNCNFFSSISANHMKAYEQDTPAQILVDIKCLQVLRALIHNHQIKLPDSPKKAKKGVYER